MTTAVKLKILALSTSYPLRAESVAGIFVHNLYKALSHKWAIEVLCPDDELTSSNKLDEVLISPIRYAPKKLQSISGAGGILSALSMHPIKFFLLPIMLLSMAINALVKARSANLIHANWAICGVIAGLVGKITKRPVLLTLRGSDVAKAHGSKIFYWQLRLALLGADHVVCVSKAMMEDLIKKFPGYSVKISYCNNGVSDDFLNTIKKSNTVNLPLKFLAAGNLIPVKGFDVLIDAVSLLPKDMFVSFIIMGEGPSRKVLQAQIDKYNLVNTVTLIGSIPYSDVPLIMSEVDVFVLSSHSEGRPNVVVEAIASALPIISSNLPGIEGLVFNGINGWTFENGNAVSLSNAILHAYAQREFLSTMGNTGRTMLSQNNSWSNTAENYSKKFHELLSA